MSTAEDAEWLRWVTKQFGSIAGEDKEINLEEFKTALQVKESFFAERFFALFDSDGSGTISLEELLKALSLLVHGNETDKLRFLFQVYDVDGSGSIDADELRVVLRWCLRESAIALPEERLGDLTLALFEAADKDRSGSITFEELREELEGFPEVMENLTISAASWLKPPPPTERSRRPRYLTRAYWHNHRSKLAFLGGYAGLNLLLFALAALRHAGLGGWVVVARGCGQCLNFNCAFLAVLMLRRCLTWLRATPVAKVLPLDQHVLFHQLVGYVVLALAAVHTGAHIANFSRLARQDGRHALAEYLLSARPGVGGLGGTASQTGLALQGLLAAMLAFSSPCVRRSGHFEVFYWTHLSYISVWTLLILHGPNFWKWFAVPGCLFALEKVLGLAWRRAGGLRIVEVNLLPSKVTHLVIERPQFFHYKPGDYIYLNIPAIAAYEWHPFTISSAPEQQETLWLHIRSLGQWTNKLYEYFQQPESPSPRPTPLSRSLREKRCRCWAQVGADGAQLSANAEEGRRLRQAEDPPESPWVSQADVLVWHVRRALPDALSLASSKKAKKRTGRRMPASITASEALAFAFQEGLCSRAGSERGSVATGGDGAVRLTLYKATGAAAPGEEDPPAGGVSPISHPRPAPPRPPRSPGGRGRAPGACGAGGGALLSPTQQRLEDQPGERRGSMASTWAKARKALRILILSGLEEQSLQITYLHASFLMSFSPSPSFALICPLLGKKPPKKQTQGRSGFSVSHHGGVRGGEEEVVTALFTLQVSTGLGETHRLCSIKCYIDGPYGTPTRRIFTSEHAVLIGAGIGITPFASILQSIMYRYRRRKQSCPSCHYSWCEDLRDEEMTLRKVDFIWINRDQKHFEWFISLLTKLEMEQAEQEPGGRFLEMHMYMTSALGKNDMKAIGLQMALDLLAAKEQRDSITGLRTRTQPGRPDWNKVFGKVAEEKRGKVQVFFCGSPALAKVIRAHCEHFGFRFFKENF
ncbi:NADPH oxidase 5 [Mycteria americana]|uniref:NADPH oxidase 5 n=1 Tax=Mycteria americana TaxID=33587 RepID=UPI003F58E5EB